MSPGDGLTEDPVLSQYLDLVGTRGAHLKRPVGDVIEQIDSTELARLPIAGAHLRISGDEGESAAAVAGPVRPELPVRAANAADVAPATTAMSAPGEYTRPRVAPMPFAVRGPAAPPAPMVAPAPVVPTDPDGPGEPVAETESVEATQEASPADLAELISSVLADPPGRHTKADHADPPVSRLQSSTAEEVQEEAAADLLDAILEAEFGVYVEMASAPPPVPAFEDWTPPVEPIEEAVLKPNAEPVFEPTLERVPDQVPSPVASLALAEPVVFVAGGESWGSAVRRPLDDEW
jgi:hypothetical protein